MRKTRKILLARVPILKEQGKGGKMRVGGMIAEASRQLGVWLLTFPKPFDVAESSIKMRSFSPQEDEIEIVYEVIEWNKLWDC